MTNGLLSNAWEETKDIVRRDGRLLAILSLALIGLPSLLLAVAMPKESSAMEMQSLGESIAVLAAALVALLGQLALARMALQPSTSVGGAISHGLSRILPQLGAVILAGLALFVLCIPLIGVLGALGVDFEPGQRLPPAGIVALLLTMAAFVYFAVRMMMVTPVAAAERIGPIAILSRSWTLTRGHFWRLLGFLLMVLATLIVVSLATAMAVGAIVMLIFGTVEPWSVAALILGIAQGTLSALFTVLFVVMAMRIYVQLSGNHSISGN